MGQAARSVREKTAVCAAVYKLIRSVYKGLLSCFPYFLMCAVRGGLASWTGLKVEGPLDCGTGQGVALSWLA